MINRRNFLANLFILPIVGLVAINLRPQSAIDFLTKEYNAIAKGVSSKDLPNHVIVGQELFDAYEAELPAIWRFNSPLSQIHTTKILKFRNMTMHIAGHGWYCKFLRG